MNINDENERRMYCPACYENFTTADNVCPICGQPLEEALKEDEEEEYIEMLMCTRV